MSSSVVSQFRMDYVGCTATCASDPASLVSRVDYDLVVLASSWETRCLSAALARAWGSQSVVLLLFDEKDVLGLRDQHDLRMVSTLADADLSIVRGSATDTHMITSELMALVAERRREVGRPLRVFVDMSSCPRIYNLLWIGWGLRGGWIAEIDYFYAEGQYPEMDRISDPLEEHVLPLVELSFAGPTRQTIPVPMLSGTSDPEKGRQYVISLGFEGPRAYRILQKAEPDSVVVILPTPGTNEQYSERALAANSMLVRDFCPGDHGVLGVPAGDAVACWKRLDGCGLLDEDEYNIAFVLCGTKPHALGMGLCALTKPHVAVLYNIPTVHRPVNVVASGKYWLYQVVDFSCPG